MVRIPKDGGQSMSMKSYSSSTGCRRTLEHVLTCGPGEQMDLGTGEIDGRRQDVEPFDPVDAPPGVRDLHLPDKDIVQGPVQAVGVEPDRERQASLRDRDPRAVPVDRARRTRNPSA